MNGEAGIIGSKLNGNAPEYAICFDGVILMIYLILVIV